MRYELLKAERETIECDVISITPVWLFQSLWQVKVCPFDPRRDACLLLYTC